LSSAGSAAGLASAESLRDEGFDGEVVIVGDELHWPYDRPPLSKQLLSPEFGADRLYLRPPKALDGLRVDWKLGVRAVGLHREPLAVILDDGNTLSCDGLVIATGVRPRRLSVSGSLRGVHTLKFLDDALALREELLPGAFIL
jgi:NADPH-dependent 2,4-dienoyl-CoA reductase/sulfur reductase-like enzyme